MALAVLGGLWLRADHVSRLVAPIWALTPSYQLMQWWFRYLEHHDWNVSAMLIVLASHHFLLVTKNGFEVK